MSKIQTKILYALLTFPLWGLGGLGIESLSAQPPVGYYDAAFGKKKEELKTAMRGIVRNHTARSYDNLWTDFQQTDKRPDGKVWDMYSDVPNGTASYYYTFSKNQCGNYGKEGDCYNREHSMPKSWFNDGTPMYTDLFHLYPTDGYVNGRRSNDPFGEVEATTAKWTSSNGSKSGAGTAASGYTGNVFEPRNEYKGDFARTYFYMVTCYENELVNWTDAEAKPMLNATKYPSFTTWAINLLLKWSRNDKVSQKEIDRNNAVYEIQKNRNPFIDYPQLAEYIWGDSVMYAFDPNMPVSIDATADDENQPIVYVSSGVLHVANISEGSMIRIYDITGRQIFHLSNLPEVFTMPLPEKQLFIIKITDKTGKTVVQRV